MPCGRASPRVKVLLVSAHCNFGCLGLPAEHPVYCCAKQSWASVILARQSTPLLESQNTTSLQLQISAKLPLKGLGADNPITNHVGLVHGQ